MRAHEVLLIRRCPVCGGRGEAIGKIPLSQGIRTVELNLDQPARLVEELSLHLLLALVELLPYKQFECRRCGHEYRLASQGSRALLYEMLVAMRPVDANPPGAQAKTGRSPQARPKQPKVAEAPLAATPAPRAQPRPQPTQAPATAKPQETPPDWTPYHLDTDLDELFDQFKDG